MRNRKLNKAKELRNDEFYTRYEDIEDELEHYIEHFENKIIYLNCDDPRQSNFWKYFLNNFHRFKLKKLISSFFVDQSYNLFTMNEKREKPFWVEYSGELIDGKVPDLYDMKIEYFKYDGDFRSQESIDLLKRSDLVVTNPPFSLFKDFVRVMFENEKKFIAIGNYISLNYNYIFNLIKEQKMWCGLIYIKRLYFIPGGEIKDRNETSVVTVTWWNNIGSMRKVDFLKTGKNYKGNEDFYKKIDGAEIINVDKVSEIPDDYNDIMAVPITFYDKWNPEQYDIIEQIRPCVEGEAKFKRFLIRRTEQAQASEAHSS